MSKPQSTPLVEEVKEEESKQVSIQVTELSKGFIDQLAETYKPVAIPTINAFASQHIQGKDNLARIKASSEAVIMDVNTVCQAVGCWGIHHLSDSTGKFVAREFALFLTSLEQASHHLQKALLLAHHSPPPSEVSK